MLAYHITYNVHNFGRPGYVHDKPIVDAFETLELNGFIEHVHPEGYGKARNVIFAVLESGLQSAERNYYSLINRKGLVTLDLEDCHDEDFIQGQWMPDELIIINASRVKIAARSIADFCQSCSTDQYLRSEYKSYARYLDLNGLAVCAWCAPVGADMLDLVTA